MYVYMIQNFASFRLPSPRAVYYVYIPVPSASYIALLFALPAAAAWITKIVAPLSSLLPALLSLLLFLSVSPLRHL